MKPTIIVAVILLAGGLVWHKLFSKEARIEAAYQACMRQVGATAESVRIGPPPQAAPPAKAESAAAGIVQGVDQIMQASIHGVGGAMCGTIRSSCGENFQGDFCQTALRQYK
jgi:hypothetical protein